MYSSYTLSSIYPLVLVSTHLIYTQLNTGVLPGPASIDLICLPVSKSQRRMWASRELDAAMEPVWLISTDTTPSWWPSNVHCRSNFSSFLLLQGEKKVMNSWGVLYQSQTSDRTNKITHSSPFRSARGQSKWKAKTEMHKLSMLLKGKNQQINYFSYLCKVSTSFYISKYSHRNHHSTAIYEYLHNRLHLPP